MAGLRIAIGEDSLLFREGLVRLLDELGHVCVAAVGDAEALRGVVVTNRPDLAILDIRMPPDNDSAGARLAVDLRTSCPDVGVVLLSQHIETRHCRDLIGAPGFGYLLKDRVLALDDFDESLRRVADGGVALDPEVVQALVRSGPGATLAALSSREQEVLALAAEGRSNTSISGALHVSERTVEAHMRSVFTKLNLHGDGATHRRVRAVITYLASG